MLFKSSRFQSWFSEVVVAQDNKGQYFYTLTASSRLRSVLSPMVFAKARMDGVQFDLATDRYEATFLFSRLSNPGGGSTGDREVLRTNNTILAGGRLGAQLGDFAEVALHTANAHQSHTLLDKQAGNPFAGSLTIGQNKTISLVKLVLRDDSPEDGVGGAAFFPDASDVQITYRDGSEDRARPLALSRSSRAASCSRALSPPTGRRRCGSCTTSTARTLSIGPVSPKTKSPRSNSC